MQIVEVNPPQLSGQMEKYELSYVSIQNLWNKHVVFLLNYEQDQGSIPCVSTKKGGNILSPFYFLNKLMTICNIIITFATLFI